MRSAGAAEVPRSRTGAASCSPGPTGSRSVTRSSSVPASPAGVAATIVDQQAGRARQRRLPVRRRQERLAGREHRMLDVVAAFLVALFDRGPGGGEHRRVFARQRHHRPGRQVVEQARGLVEEQRQVVLNAGRCQPLAHVAVERHAGQVALEAGAEAAPEVAHRLRPEAELARGQQVDARQPISGALRFGVEGAHALHAQVHQVDAQRHLAAHREHVEQRAADRELTGNTDLGHAGVAGRREPQPERGEVEFLADVDGECVSVDERAWRQPLQRGRQVGDHDCPAQRRQACQRPQPLRDDVRVRRELVVGQGLVARECQHRQRGRCEEPDFFLQPRGSGGIGRDQQQRCADSTRGPGQVQRGTRAGQAGPFQQRTLLIGQGKFN